MEEELQKYKEITCIMYAGHRTLNTLLMSGAYQLAASVSYVNYIFLNQIVKDKELREKAFKDICARDEVTKKTIRDELGIEI